MSRPKYSHEVIVLGAGPGGSEALYRLARAGVGALALEKRLPGENKACGGGIPPQEVRVFGELPPEAFDYPMNGVVITGGGRRLKLDLRDEKGIGGYNLRREVYDEYLRERAREHGGVIRHGETVLGIEPLRPGFRVRTDKGQYQSGFVFVALGVKGFAFYPSLGFPPYPQKGLGVGIQKRLDGELGLENDQVELHFDHHDLPRGYWWVFPKRGCTYVGCCTQQGGPDKVRLGRLLDRYIAERFGQVQVLKTEGGLVPSQPVSNPAREGVFLLGDSAGLANPIHGGGIFEARMSGKLAAEAVIAHLKDYAQDANAVYTQAVDQEIVGYSHRWDARMQRFFFSPQSVQLIWDMGEKKQSVRNALGVIISSLESHAKAYRYLYEAVFERVDQDLISLVAPYSGMIEKKLETLFKPGDALTEIVNYSLLGGGKRLRSSLALMMCEALGGDLETVLPGALSYELAHTGSLIHDDILDKGTLRRGKRASHLEHGMEAAIIAGDALVIKSFEVLAAYKDSPLGKEALAEILLHGSRAGVKACQGEVMDLAMGQAPQDFSVLDYFRLIDHKTAALIQGPCRIAAIIAGRPDLKKSAAAFGRHLGMAFQVFDDAKDIFSPEEATLKKRFSDILNQNPSLYIIWALRYCPEPERTRFRELLGKNQLSEEDVNLVYRVVELSGVADFTRKAISFHLNRARKSLDGFPDTPSKKRLSDLCQVMDYWAAY